jgi:ribulose-phosphate 3-epimerase
MVYQPFNYVERMVEAGADMVTFHFEATEDVEETLEYIRKCNIKAGLAFCPETSESFIPKYLDKCDHILLMTVEPGFGGQAFRKEVLEKIEFTRDICDKLKVFPDIAVDGGIDAATAKLCVNAGANVLVAGTYLFHAPSMKDAVQILRNSAQ